MSKKLIISLVLSAGLASAIYAMPVKGEMCMKMQKQMNDKTMCHKSNMNGNNYHKMMKRNHGMRDNYSMNIMRAFKKLDLSEKQRTEIRTIVINSLKNQKKISVAFSKTSFNKAKFIKQAMNKKENMIKSKANMIEKTYNVLSKKQKEQLKVLLDLNI